MHIHTHTLRGVRCCFRPSRIWAHPRQRSETGNIRSTCAYQGRTVGLSSSASFDVPFAYSDASKTEPQVLSSSSLNGFCFQTACLRPSNVCKVVPYRLPQGVCIFLPLAARRPKLNCPYR